MLGTTRLTRGVLRPLICVHHLFAGHLLMIIGHLWMVQWVRVMTPRGFLHLTDRLGMMSTARPLTGPWSIPHHTVSAGHHWMELQQMVDLMTASPLLTDQHLAFGHPLMDHLLHRVLHLMHPQVSGTVAPDRRLMAHAITVIKIGIRSFPNPIHLKLVLLWRRIFGTETGGTEPS